MATGSFASLWGMRQPRWHCSRVTHALCITRFIVSGFWAACHMPCVVSGLICHIMKRVDVRARSILPPTTATATATMRLPFFSWLLRIKFGCKLGSRFVFEYSWVEQAPRPCDPWVGSLISNYWTTSIMQSS